MKDYDSERNQFGSILHAVRRKHQTMIEHSLFYYPYVPFTNAQLPGLTVTAQYLEKLYILDPVDARLETFSADYHARRAVKLLMDEKIAILQTMRPADVLATDADLSTDAIRRDMPGQGLLELCEAQGGERWTLSLAKVLEGLQTDRAMRNFMGDVARQASRDAGQYRQEIDAHPPRSMNSPSREEPITRPTPDTGMSSSTGFWGRSRSSLWRWARRSQ
jgi:hypothetical protein